MYHELAAIKELGFYGFYSVTRLWQNHFVIPRQKGIYVVLNPEESQRQFLVKGVGGHFKGRDPNIAIQELVDRWVDNCHLLYIGKAGGEGSSVTLQSRLRQYLNFGKGKPVGHYGGRLIWQIEYHADLLIAWKVLPDTDPRAEEKKLLTEFENYYGKLPFANIVR